eukprot:COSAG02_NODE_45532_length_356_cov_0.813230_2_plen_82_part_00
MGPLVVSWAAACATPPGTTIDKTVFAISVAVIVVVSANAVTAQKQLPSPWKRHEPLPGGALLQPQEQAYGGVRGSVQAKRV